MANQIRFDVGFNVNKTGLNELQNALVQIQAEVTKASNTGNLTQKLKESSNAARQLSDILNQSWNSKLGQLDLSKVNNGIKEAFGSVSNLKTKMEQSGPAGSAAYNQVASAILNTNLQLKQSNKLLDEMAVSMANTVKWGITSNIFNNITGSIQKAYGYTKNLDSSLNDIRIVTDKSAESMEKFAKQANSAAKGLGASTLDYTQASLIYYQQGLSDEDVAARAETTLKAANVTGQSGEEVSEQLTAVWNGYKVTAQEAELYVDKLAAVAADTAADLEELSTGMSKVASAASLMGVDIDQLNAQLATIVSVTRQAPESVGTALKTIYARMGDIEAGLDTETTLGHYTEEMANMGFNVLDMNGHLRDMGEVIEEIGSKWSSMSREQQISLSQTVAGTRQYNNLLALFDNWDMYTNAIETSANAAGTLQHQQDIYMESTKAHLKELSTEAEKTYDILFDQETVNGFTDALTGALGIFNDFLQGTGGGLNSFAVLGSGIVNIFSKQIGNAINKQILNLDAFKENAEGIELKEQIIQDIQTQHSAQGEDVSNGEALLKEAEYAQQILNIRSQLTTEEYNELTTLQQQIGLDEQRIQGIEQYREIARDIMNLDDEQIANFDELESAYQERIEIENESLQILRERRGAFNEELQIYQDLNESDENRAQSAENLKSILEQLPQNQADQIEATRIISDLEAGRSLNETDILNIQRLQRNQVDEQRELVNRLRMGAQGVRDAESGVYSQLIQQRNAREALLQQQIRERQQAELMSNMTKGFSTLFMGLSTISGIIKTINDDSIDMEDKAKAIFTTLLTTLPTIIGNFSSLKSILPGTILVMTKFAAAHGVTSASEAIATGTTLSFKQAIDALTTSTVTFMGVTAPLWAILIGAVAIIGAVTAAIYFGVKAWNADADAAKKAAEQVENLTNRYNELTEAAKAFKDTVNDYSEAKKEFLELGIEADNYAEKLETVNEKARELIETFGLWDNYTIDSNGLIIIDETKLDEIKAKKEKAANDAKDRMYGAKIYNEKAQQKSTETNAKRSLGNIIVTEKTREDNENDDTETSRALTNSEIQNIIDLVKKANMEGIDPLDFKNYVAENINNKIIKDNIDSIFTPENAKIFEDLAKSAENAAKAQKDYAKQIMSSIVEEQHGDKIRNIATDSKGNVNEGLSNLINQATTTRMAKADAELQESLDKKIEAAEDNINNKIKDTNDLENFLKEEEIEGYDVSNDKQLALTYAEKVLGYDRDSLLYTGGTGVGSVTTNTGEKVVDKLSDEEMRREIARQAMIDKIKAEAGKDAEKDNTKFLEAVDKLVASAPDAGAKYGVDFSSAVLESIANDNFNTINLSSMFGELDPSEVANLEALDENQLLKVLGISEKTLKELGYESAEQFEQAFDAGLANYDVSAFINKIKGNISTLSTGIEEFFSDDGLSQETIQALESEYESLGKIWDRNSEEYIDALQEIRELEEEKLKEGMIYASGEAWEKASESLKKYEKSLYGANGVPVEVVSEEVFEELDQNLKAFFEKEYELEIAVTDDLLTDIDNIVSAAENAATAVELIGKGFKVAAKDSEELFKIFPELAHNAEVLADGTIQLDSSVTQAILKNNGIEIDSDKEVTAQAIDNRIAELEAKKTEVASQIELIKNSANIEQDLNKLLGENYAGWSEYESNLSKATADDEVFNSGKSAEAVIDNWAAKEEAAMGYAQTAAEAESDKHQISSEAPRVPGAKGSIKTSVETKSTAGDVESDVKDNEDLKEKVIGYLNNLYESYEKQIAELTVGKSQLFGSVKDIEDAAKGKKDGEDRDEEEKKAEDEIDRYWELNKAIEAVAEELSDLDKKQSKLYGKELIASLKEENKLLEQQAEKYKALAAEQQREASELQGLLSAYGVVFDAQGGVANYLAATQAALARYNQAVAAYNAFLIDEATFKAEQRAYENFKSLLDRYEALYYEEMRETQNKLDEIHRQELENNLKAWEVEIQLKLDMSEIERQWDDFFKDINENFKLVYEDLDATMQNLADKMKTYQGGDGDIATTLKAIKDVQAEIDKMKNGGESDMFESISQAQEKLKELNEQLQDSALAMKELWEEAWETYLEGIEQAADQLDDLMERYENINEQIEYQRELIELLYGEEAYELMDKYYEAQQKNTMSEIDSLKQQAELWKQQYEEALAIDEANGTISEDTQKFYELWQEAQDELNGKVIDYIELLQNDYKNTISSIINDLELSLTGGTILDDVKTQWERLQEQSDKYFDNVEKIYEISNLANKYKDAIANTSNLANQQKLQDLYDKEMEYLENKKNLTEYDIQAADARYQLALRQIALEEAQQNKSTMKLTRGADGNWSYQYVADEGDIASKQQELLQASQEYYQITKDGYEQNLSDMLDAQETYYEMVQEINEKYMNDEAERSARLEELYQIYFGEGGILTNLYTENEERRTNLADATVTSLMTYYQIDEENFERMTSAEQELILALKDGTIESYDEILEKGTSVCQENLEAWTSAAQDIINQWNKDKGESVRAQIEKAYEAMKKANDEYKKAVDDLEKSVEQDFGEDGITGALNDAQEETEELDDKTEELCDNAESNLERYREAVNAIGDAWESVKSQIQDAIDLIREYLNIAASAGSGNTPGGSGPGGPGITPGGPNDGPGGPGTTPGGPNDGPGGPPKVEDEKSVSVTTYDSDQGGNGVPTIKTVSKNKVERTGEKKEKYVGPYPYYFTLKGEDEARWVDKNNMKKLTAIGVAFKTGGYTGNWEGESGKLAFLHSKELVLNAKDTENILSAVNTVRSIANLGDSINQSIMNGISQMVLGLTGLGKYGNYSVGETNSSGDTIFEIQANFPNANDVESIREAILSLPNLASQYIARNKK